MCECRRPGPGDAALLAALVDELNAHEGGPRGHFDAAAALRDVIAPGAPVRGLIAWDGEAAAGYTLWHFAYETAWAARGGYVADLHVRAAHRGGGVADALLRAVAREVAAGGGSYLWWTTRRANARARAFYDRRARREDGVVAYAAAHDAFRRLLE